MPNTEDHYLEPKSTQGMFTLPCGILDNDGGLHTDIHLREMTGIEEEILAGKGEVTAKLNKVMANCVESIGSLPHCDVETIKRLTVVDRVFLLVALRRVSLGDSYGMKVRCPACSHESNFQTDLGNLEVRNMEDPSRRSYEGTMPSGKSFVWHPMTGMDEEWLNEARKKLKGEGVVTLSMMARMDELDGKPLKKDPKHRRDLVGAVSEVAGLSLRDRNHLRRTFEKTEGDVDTELDFECESCGHEFSADLRVDPAAFFFPSEI